MAFDTCKETELQFVAKPQEVSHDGTIFSFYHFSPLFVEPAI